MKNENFTPHPDDPNTLIYHRTPEIQSLPGRPDIPANWPEVWWTTADLVKRYGLTPGDELPNWLPEAQAFPVEDGRGGHYVYKRQAEKVLAAEARNRDQVARQPKR